MSVEQIQAALLGGLGVAIIVALMVIGAPWVERWQERRRRWRRH